MTQVDFHFITPTGDPIQEGFVEITLSESAWLQIESGVVLPRIVFGYTDLEGRISFDLWPVKTAEYTVTVTDTHQDNEVVTKHYFFVPRSDVPVRLQDILMEPEPTPKPYDEASIEAIQQNRIQAQWARDETDSLHEQVIVREANVADMQADVTVRQTDVKVMQDQVTVLRDTTLLSQQAAETAEDNAETAQAAAEAALADAVNEAVKAATARVASESALAQSQTIKTEVTNLRQDTLGFKNAAEAAAATAESAVVTHEGKADPHPQYLSKNQAAQEYETIGAAQTVLDSAKAHTDAHTVRVDNPHGITKAQLGLDLVDNVSSATLLDRASHTGLQGIATISGLSSLLEEKLGAVHAISGDHDNRYYTKQQADDLFTKPRLNNYDGMRAPLETDDEEDGYERGSSWFDQSTGIMWVCTASTLGAAHWMQTSINVSEIGTAAMEDTAVLVARANHTGTQTLATISDAGTAAAANVEDFEPAGSSSSESSTAVATHEAAPDPHPQYVQEVTGKGLSEADFTTVEKDKLAGIEDAATADQTGAEIKALYEAELDTNAYTDAEKAKLSGIEAAATADQTGAEIKLAYEGELDTNAFTDAEKTKLTGVAEGATANSSDTTLLDRTNHTGTQTLATISDAGTAAAADTSAFEAAGAVSTAVTAHKSESSAHDSTNITYDTTTVWAALSGLEAQMGDVETILIDINGAPA